MCRQPDGIYIINPKQGKPFVFDTSIEAFGLVTHRTGEYFELIGFFIEQLTGVFGKVEIVD